jgi:hypothetical protein
MASTAKTVVLAWCIDRGSERFAVDDTRRHGVSDLNDCLGGRASFPDPAATRPVTARITVHTPELAAVTPIADPALAHIGEGLVWLSITADDFAAAVRFFGETPGLGVAFDEGTPWNRPAGNGDKIQLFVPEAPLFGHYRSRKPVSSLPGARRSGPQRRRDIRRARVGRCLDVA